ncbi:DUF5753 domain-containing protein [Streptomyces sp. NPDC059849]|uniref:DUF5753 domain-containing protein n=1 Tax=Streptomyces sp. NPDC059849 TaxID=3346969 RepID=UPI00365995EE
MGFESEARTIRNYESLFIPGPAQTESYARAVVRGVLPTASRKEVEQRVQARVERQALLTKEDPLQLWAIVDEAAVRRLVGGREVMRTQARHLLPYGDYRGTERCERMIKFCASAPYTADSCSACHTRR